MVAATYKLEIDWDDSGTFDGGDEDVTADLVEVSYDLGRSGASSLQDVSRSGKLIATLRNNSDKYNSFNSSSAIFGDILPGRRVKLSTTAPFAVVLWSGFLESISPSFGKMDSSGQKKAELVAYGPLAKLSDAKVDIAMQSNQTTGVLVGAVLDAAGWPVADRLLDAGETTVKRFWTSSEKNALNAIRELELTEAGFVRETPDGKIAFEARTHRQHAPHTDPQVVISDADGTGGAWGSSLWGSFEWGSGFPYQNIKQLDPLALVVNKLRANVQLHTVQSIAVLWTHPEANTGGDAPAIGPGDTVTYWANYPGPSSATQAVAVDEWTTPVVTTDYTANAESDGTGTDLSADLSITATKFGNSMKLEIENIGTSLAYLTLLQARGTAIYVSDPVTVQAESTASQGVYGERSFQRSAQAQWIPSTRDAQDWADVQIELFKDAVPVLQVEYLANSSPLHLNEALLRQVSDRVTLVADNNVGFGIDDDFFIERVNHKISNYGQTHRVAYLLSSAQPLDEFWVLGLSMLGTQTRINY